VHLFSADPPAAGAWYAKHFGWRVVAQKDKREFRGIQIAPAAFVTAGHVSMIIYPLEYLRALAPAQWKDRQSFATTRGRVIDHLGFSLPDLDATLATLRKEGVIVAAEPRGTADGRLRYAFIEGPDQVAIELLEDRNPPPTSMVE
jgi:catechol 2,3-dioxygenase-like lactoylglutathione lyase family enzyme